MVQILGRVSVRDVSQFLGVLSTRGASLGMSHGGRRAQVFRVSGAETSVVLLLDWESRAAFEGLLADPAVREMMESSGATAPPEFTIIEKLTELSA